MWVQNSSHCTMYQQQKNLLSVCKFGKWYRWQAWFLTSLGSGSQRFSEKEVQGNTKGAQGHFPKQQLVIKLTCMYYMSMLACADMYNDCPEILKGHRTAAVHRKKIWTSCCAHCNFSQVSIPEELQFTLACMDLSPYSGQKKNLCCHCLVRMATKNVCLNHLFYHLLHFNCRNFLVSHHQRL